MVDTRHVSVFMGNGIATFEALALLSGDLVQVTEAAWQSLDGSKTYPIPPGCLWEACSHLRTYQGIPAYTRHEDIFELLRQRLVGVMKGSESQRDTHESMTPSEARRMSEQGVRDVLRRAGVTHRGDCIETSVIFVVQEIDAIMKLYKEFQDQLRESRRLDGRGRFQILLDEATGVASRTQRNRLSRDPKTLEEVGEYLRMFRTRFASVQVNPFRRNAAYLVKDLDHAFTLCDPQNIPKLKERLGIMRSSIQWVLRLHELQMMVLIPLLLLLEHSLREPGNTGCPKEVRSLKPKQFAALDGELKQLIGRVNRMTDAGFDQPVKVDVLAGLNAAKRALHDDHFFGVVGELRQVAKWL